VTFGFNVFLGQDGGGNCIVTKGEIEVNGHVAKIAWHVSIHDGIDAFSGQPVFATTFADASGGQCVVVGVPNMRARANPQGGTEDTQFEACDNDRGARQNSRTDAMRWRTRNHGDTGLTFLTGGNIVDHT
jgi:imidazole glycerol phosphate synthase subunit HisF